jgi:Tfp pilus assembly protein PilV
MKRSKKKNNKGMALVEVIAALGIAVVVLTAMVSLTLFTVRSSLNSKLLLQGTKTATREAELVRSYRDSSATWEVFLAAMQNCHSATCCMNQGTGLPISGVCTEGTGAEIVTRSFTASNSSGGALVTSDNIVKIDITANWVVGGVTKNTHLYTNLSNWR